MEISCATLFPMIAPDPTQRIRGAPLSSLESRASDPAVHDAPLPRARGTVRLAVGLGGGATRLQRLYQAGSAKALVPRGYGTDLTAVLLNTAGGITGGDRFSYHAEAGAQTELTLTTQTAERAYRTRAGEIGQLDVDLVAHAGASLAWLPQETILFERSALSRRLCVSLDEDATFLAIEPIVFGRRAMGEVPRCHCLKDQWRVWRGGRLVFADALRLVRDEAHPLDGPATLGKAGAMASLLLISDRAEAMLGAVRSAMPARGGASLVRPGVLLARMVAPDGFTLRRRLASVVEIVRAMPMPHVWRM